MMGAGQDYASLADMESWARGMMASRDPDFIIGPGTPDYIRRWWIVPRNESLNQYLHLTQRSDEDRALHDHPWSNTSFIIAGGYWEVMPIGGSSETQMLWRGPGDVITREATAAHRLIIPDGSYCISLFATGPKVREWGFHCPQGWRHWREFTDQLDGASVTGKGCD
jgi:hypothetical protein